MKVPLVFFDSYRIHGLSKGSMLFENFLSLFRERIRGEGGKHMK